MTQEAKIKKEIRRLRKLFAGIDENQRELVDSLINRFAYITVSLQDVEQLLNKTGWVEAYQNGENQFGMKKSAAADVHISLTKNLNALAKQLLEILPPKIKEEDLFGDLDE